MPTLPTPSALFLLVAVLVVGKLVAGSKRWLIFGPISLQPSELAKVAVILVLARYYSRTASTKGMRLRDLIIPMFLIAVPFVLIVKQPDLGTAMMILLIAATLTVFIKIEKRAMIAIVSFGAVAIPMTWLLLKGYQKQRILTFLEPDRDPLGAGYHIIQSKIAIGSGMLSGKGFLKGTQNALSFLPEHHTDFIFSVLAEDWGFIGSAAVLFIVFNFDCLGPEHRPWLQGSFWRASGNWHHGIDRLGGFYQHWHGDGTDAGGGYSAAVYQLRRLRHPQHDAVHGNSHEYQHAQIHGRVNAVFLISMFIKADKKIKKNF